jgi:hypothetical protein
MPTWWWHCLITWPMLWTLPEDGRRKMAAVTSRACAMVRGDDLPDRFVLLAHCLAVWWDIWILDDVHRCEVSSDNPTWSPPSSKLICDVVANDVASSWSLYFVCKVSFNHLNKRGCVHHFVDAETAPFDLLMEKTKIWMFSLIIYPLHRCK